MINETILKRIAVLAILIFYVSVLYFSVNIPQQDDFDSILAYLINTGPESNSSLFDMHVSHRVVLTRLLAKLSVILGGGLDLRLLSYIGSLSLLGVLSILYRSMPNESNRQLVLSLVCLCIFSFFHWSNMAWATASVQNYTIILVAFGGFHLLEKQSLSAAVGAITLGLIAPYINSSGLLVLPTLLAWAIISPANSRRNSSLIITLSSTIFVSFYFFFQGFEEQSLGEPLLSNLFPNGLGSVFNIVRAYLVSSAGYLHFEFFALVGGIFANLYFLLLIKCRYYKQNKVVFYSYLFLLASIGLVALFRNEMGIRQLVASRYQIYTLLINALIIISFFELNFARYIPIKNLNQTVLVLCLMLYGSSLYYLGNLNSEKNKIEQGIVEFENGDASFLYHPTPLHAERILEQAIEKDVYQIRGK